MAYEDEDFFERIRRLRKEHGLSLAEAKHFDRVLRGKPSPEATQRYLADELEAAGDEDSFEE